MKRSVRTLLAMGHSVLIVDDSATMRKIIMRGLRQAGLSIDAFHEAANGAEGLAMLDRHAVDLVLSDINMPQMGGLDFLRAVRAREDSPPVVMVTTEGADDVVQAAVDGGAQGYLRKPFTPDAVQDVLGPLLP